jgi:hypothetical protein
MLIKMVLNNIFPKGDGILLNGDGQGNHLWGKKEITPVPNELTPRPPLFERGGDGRGGDERDKGGVGGSGREC